MKISILSKSSSREDPYLVDFIKKNNRLFITCNCPAGEFSHGQKLCKHKIRLSLNDTAMLYDIDQIEQLHQVNGWVKKTELQELINDLNEAEKEVEKFKRKVKKIKSHIERSMREGMDEIE